MTGKPVTPRAARGRRATRRRFLQTAAAGAAGLVATGKTAPAPAALREEHPPESGNGGTTQLSPHLAVFHGPINVGILRDGNRALLIDCGDASVAEALGPMGVTSVDRVLFTHHHRDQACGAHRFVERGARIGVPAGERDHFDKVAEYWANPKSRWHIYNQHPHHLMLAEPVDVDAALTDGGQITWGPAKIRVLGTPGHTDGSVSYLVEVDGHKTLFSGDLLYDEGRLWDLFSLQKGFQRGKRRISDYHGFLGAQWQLLASLERIGDAKPDRLVPSHGRMMGDPPRAIRALVDRLAACYDKYVAISALRHYFPELFSEFAGREGHMPIRPGKEVPDCLAHIGTTWILLSKEKAAFAMDCGSPRVVADLKKRIQDGQIDRVEGLWVTHYHDDHVNAIPGFQEAFDCPCITDEHVARVITDPLAWRLPCISPNAARVDRTTRDGETWQWHEFTLTAYHLPGQTLYHSALLVEGQGAKMLFVGDSFTMAGIDDYCAHNRNWLGHGVGFDRAIALIDRLRPTHVFNCHVADAFDFTPEECRFMRANLAEREKCFGELVAWDHPNYATDEPWVRCTPYEQQVKPGAEIEIGVVITNHSDAPRRAACRAVLPRTWAAAGELPPAITTAAVEKWPHAEVPAKSEGRVRLVLEVPPNARSGRYVIPVDLVYGDRKLPQFQEAVVVVLNPETAG